MGFVQKYWLERKCSYLTEKGLFSCKAAAGADIAQIMRQTRHRSVTVAMQYIDEGQLFSNPASRAIGL